MRVSHVYVRFVNKLQDLLPECGHRRTVTRICRIHAARALNSSIHVTVRPT